MSQVFSKEAAINFIIDDQLQYGPICIVELVGAIDGRGKYELEHTKYLLSKVVKAQKTTDHMRAYHDKLAAICRSLKTYEDSIEEFISDFREEMETFMIHDLFIYDLKTRYDFGENTEKLIRELF